MKKIKVAVAGLSVKQDEGKMARLIAEAIGRQEDMELCPYGLSGEEGTVHIPSAGPMQLLIPMGGHESFLKNRRGDIDLIVDFTAPKAVNRNAELYCAAGIPFVMGTTGGDRQKLTETIKKSNISAVVATNFSSAVAIFQEMIRFAGASFPGGLKGFRLIRKESHQATKPDPSGTMVNIQDDFASLIGSPVEKEQIIMERDPVVQELELLIPQQYLKGHGYHTYTLMSPDGTVKLQFTHNLLGRSDYVVGALKAIRFLAGRKQFKCSVYSMIDVLQNRAP